MTTSATRGPVLGVIGGGQLARMTIHAAGRLGIDVRLLATPSDESAPGAVAHTVRGDARRLSTLEWFARECDVVTFDHEGIDPDVVERLEVAHVVRPGSVTLRFADKAHQRVELAALGHPVPGFEVTDALSLHDAARELGRRVVVKEARGGYDGRGVHIASGEAALDRVARLGPPERRLVVEECLDIRQELSVLVVRTPGGETVTYPAVETVQVDGVCREVVTPARVPADLSRDAEMLALRLAQDMEAVGVLAVELFVVGDGRLVVNEVAPRPHNSGHLTIEGSATSQFENHVRAVLDMPLGATTPTAPAVAMVNILGASEGDPRQRLAAALAVPDAHVHLYGKSPRAGRKLGHVTARGDTHQQAVDRARAAARALVPDHLRGGRTR